jgi:hypothetical protein
MPVVKKTKGPRKKVTRRKSKLAGGLASRVQSVTSLPPKGMKINVYGRGKTGKTRFACTFKKKALLIGTENGTDSVRNVKGVDYVQITCGSDVDEAIEFIRTNGYKSAILDTAGGLQDLILKEVLGLDEIPVQKSWGMARQQDWGTVAVQTKERLRNLLDLADNDGVDVCVIAHERSFEDNGDGDLLFPTIGSALTPSVAGWLNGACDYVCQTFIREKYEEKRSKVGKKVTVTKKIVEGEYDYCLRVGPHPVFMTGFRVAPGVVIPDSVSDPTYQKIRAIIDG